MKISRKMKYSIVGKNKNLLDDENTKTNLDRNANGIAN
jgi:hypothetical protein